MLKLEFAMLGGLALAVLVLLLPASGLAEARDDQGQAGAVNAFALDLFQVLRQSEGNLLVSPLSVHTALAMTLAGARGDTEAGMLAALHLPDTLERGELQTRVGGFARSMASDGPDAPYELNMANRLWVKLGSVLAPDFLALMETAYGAGLEILDFAGAPEASRETINAWVEDRTNDRITNLIPPGLISANTKLVLTNAVYFLGKWRERFSADATAPLPFYLANGGEVVVPTMHGEVTAKYALTRDVAALELPYEGGELSMVVLLPPMGRLDQYERELTPAMLDQLLTRMGLYQVEVWLPKWETTSEYRLSEALKALGLEDLFNGGADFSGMGAVNLEISEVLHKAFVSVDEQGTEAAAATAVLMEDGAGIEHEQPFQFVADHPFLYLIRHQPSGAILFMGRMADPSQ